ncbi:AraC family transcriptional regulator [Olivibacter sp. SDN3]|uniref:AraC family transcriptional regulator n=1 Tax=Olivibacter sp. SDN3 TaxID=2764720 RepID=UPI001650E47D|nr:AraC family transcriptional regulator [Olivibacter sp. SDN3]QNL51539.1 AraC family transcriptional regulator [Olivibacter sp. SDN3]
MSEPIFQHIYLNNEESYNILKVRRPYFVVPWHFHPEFELMYIHKGEGTRFVGDHIENFVPGDLVLVGSNLPHCWKSSRHHHESKTNGTQKAVAEARVLLFKESCFGERFFDIAEFSHIKELFVRAQQGIYFYGKTRKQVVELIHKAYTQSGVKRFLLFIDILHELACSRDYKSLCSVGYKSISYSTDMLRLNKVFDFLMDNYTEPIKLEDAAAEAYMSPTAFCRYFKAHTNKTFIYFLNELRIGFAKELLIADEINVSDIYLSCGFQNASNFYEQFKKIVGCSPLQFRKQHEEKSIYW